MEVGTITRQSGRIFGTQCRYLLKAKSIRNTAYFTRWRNRPYELPCYHYSWSRCLFVNRSYCNFIWRMVFILYHFEL